MIQNQASHYLNETLKLNKDYFNTQRFRAIEKLLDYYGGDNTEQYTKEFFKSSAYTETPIITTNMTKRLIDRISQLYTLGASRNLGASKSVNDLYANITKPKDLRLKHIEKMTNLLGTVAVHICWDVQMQSIDYVPIYYYDVHLDPNNPLNAIGIEYPIQNPVEDRYQPGKNLYKYYDAEKIQTLDSEKKVISEEPNPYGIFPFVFLHKDHQLDSFFCYPAYDIMSSNEALNILFTEISLGLRYNLFGQYVVSGVYQDSKVERFGSDEVITIPEEADMSILNPSGNINDALRFARTLMEIVAQNHHLTISVMETHQDRPSSGIALKIKELERNETRLDTKELWRFYEHRMHSIEKVISNYNGYNIDYEFEVDFNEPDLPIAVKDEIEMNTWKLENNLTTREKILQKENNELSDKEAAEIIRKNKEQNGQTEKGPEESGTIFSRLRNQAATN
tara:strand:- start:3628 stop:4980 length:1353 start_codon:yes stop_codon:yes gene_type:complete